MNAGMTILIPTIGVMPAKAPPHTGNNGIRPVKRDGKRRHSCPNEPCSRTQAMTSRGGPPMTTGTES